jgi:hypothetical protein
MPRYTWKANAVSFGERTIYDWVVLDAAGNSVMTGLASTSAAAALEAEQAIWRLKHRNTTAEINTNDQDR